jgi:ceramide glucosyltransferase
MSTTISILTFALAAVGLVLCGVQVGSLLRHVSAVAPTGTTFPGISVLKPLCGIDDRLMANLRTFAELDYANYEVLLGVRDKQDAAYPLARHAAACWPSHVRVVLQRGEPGFNPKVNQLITLAREAKNDLFVVSDSNVAVPRGYLAGIAAHFEDPELGLLTHPIAGVGERTLASLMDNAYLSTGVSPGTVAAHRVAGMPLVVGKSMALRRHDLRLLGGFEAVKDVLAEDFVIGKLVTNKLKKRVAIANRPVMNVSCRRTLRSFLNRYQRWSTMQRKAVGTPLYSMQLLLHPVPLAIAGVALAPSRRAFAALLLCWTIKATLEQLAARAIRKGGLPPLAHAMLPVKDLLLFYAWLAGFARGEVCWRGNRLAVLEGTQLMPIGGYFTEGDRSRPS